MKSEQSQAMAKKKAPKIQLEFYINEQAMLSKIAGKSVNWVHFSLKNNLDASSMRKIMLFERMDGEKFRKISTGKIMTTRKMFHSFVRL